MTKAEIIDLLQKYQDGTSSPEETELLENWYNLMAAKGSDVPFPESVWARKEATYTYILNSKKERPVKPVVRLWPRIIAVAAAVVTITVGTWLYITDLDTTRHSELVSVSQDIVPGKQGATLTLANGKKIRLSDAVDGQLAEEAGVEISKSANGQLVYKIKGDNAETNKINTLSTAKGETYIVTLPDNSKVWLNAASSLTYAAGLRENGKRRVKLDGEAYFEISKDKLHPFIVESKGQEIEVMGTHFNVSSYTEDKETRTTLLEGLVKISENKSHHFNLLKPGQQGISNRDGEIKVVHADLEEAVAWKNGFFRFNQEPLLHVMDKLSRWYSFDVSYEGGMEKYSEFTFGGFVPRSTPALVLLKLMEKTGEVRFEVSGKKVLVKMKTQ